MEKQFLFVVHGMGRHLKDSWADPWKKVIYENLRQYQPYTGKSDEELARDTLEILPISYDEVFEESFRNQWRDLAGAIEDRASLGKLAPVLEWIDTADSEDDRKLFWDFLLDPLLWFTVKQARQATIAHVAKQLAAGLDRIKEETGANKDTKIEASIFAHSLGTSVIHDTLLSLSDSELTQGVFEGRNYKWQTLVMMGNVSRLLQTWVPISSSIPVDAYKVHGSDVRPGTRKSLVRAYFNLRHRADPFTWPREFDPQDWDTPAFKTYEIKRYDELKSVHDFETYFDHPTAQLQIFRKVLGQSNLGTRAEQEQAWSAYKQIYGRTAGDEFLGLHALLQGNSERKMGIVELAKFLAAVVKELKS